MQAWCPKHEVLLFQVFLSPNVVLKDIDMETVLECIRLLHVSEADDAIGSFPNGVLKAVAKDSVALWKLAACDAKSLRLAQGFLDELISHKTGIAKRAATNPPAEVLTQEEFSTLSTELTKLVVKLAHPKVDRLVNPWHAYADFLASQIPPKAPVEQPEKVDKTEKPVPPRRNPNLNSKSVIWSKQWPTNARSSIMTKRRPSSRSVQRKSKWSFHLPSRKIIYLKT